MFEAEKKRMRLIGQNYNKAFSEASFKNAKKTFDQPESRCLNVEPNAKLSLRALFILIRMLAEIGMSLTLWMRITVPTLLYIQ